MIALLALAFAAAFQLPERPTARVNDYAKVLKAEAVSGLERKFSDFETKSGHQAVVAIFADIGGDPIEEVAARLFEKWRLGSKEKNDGVLLMLAMKEHAVRIEVGYGLEGDLPDALAGRIIREDMTPFLRDGQVATAILVFERRLEQIFVEHSLKAPKVRSSSGRAGFLFWVVVILIVIFIIKEASSRGGPTIGSDGVIRTRRRGTGIFWGGGGWSGGGGGSGWGGGGGGLSGGGGASGRW